MKKYEIDMCHGPIFPKMVRFLIPLILSGILQLLFHTADMVVIGRFCGSSALAAVGANTFLINLQVNLFVGISVGANVIAARNIGAGSDKDFSETVHTSILMAVIGGLTMILICNLICRWALIRMATPEDVLEDAVIYIRIYFFGMPFLMLYNFGAAILRAMGDTKRPLYYLTAAGIINVFLNVFFVVVFHMGVAGVALATTLSQGVSAICVLRCLSGTGKLEFKKLRIHMDKMLAILKVGLLAGFQSVLFNIANIMVQSSVNSFGSIVMAGNTAANNIEHFVYVVISSTSSGVISFTSQNMGAGDKKRAVRSYWEGVGFAAATVTILGVASWVFGPWLLLPYTTDEEVIAAGVLRLSVVAVTYGLNSVQDVMASGFRGLGFQWMPTIISLIGICATRIFWVSVIFPIYQTREVLYMTYPVSWIITSLMLLACYFIIVRPKMKTA